MQRPTNWHDRHGTSGPHVPLSLPRVELEVTRGRARHPLRRVEQRTYLIGAAPDCDLVLGDLQFADVHAYLLRDARGVTLRWLGQNPELTVNGQVVETAIGLADQDRLRTGPYEFKIHIHWPKGSRQAQEARSVVERRETEAASPTRHAAQRHGSRRASLRLYTEPSGSAATAEPAPPTDLPTSPEEHPLVWLDLDRGESRTDGPPRAG
jgi:hypothetical protein